MISTFTDSATSQSRKNGDEKIGEKGSSTGHRQASPDGDTVSHRRPGQGLPGASRRWAGTPAGLHPSCTLVGGPG